jgi:hypothetical protein
MVRARIKDLAISIMLAYPLSGCLCGMVDLERQPSLLGHPFIWFLEVTWRMIATTLYGGFPPADEGLVHYTNMYPWIIATAVGLFFGFSRGWRGS